MNQELSAAIQADPESESAWEAWFREVYPRVVYITARSSSGNVELAEEMTQAAIERFLRYRAYEKVDSDSAAVAYLARTAQRLMMDAHRRAEREPAWAPEKLDQQATPMPSTPTSDELESWLERLPEADKVVLKLVLSGRKIKEIAEQLGLGYSTVGMRIQRAKARLKDIASGV